MKAQRTRKCGRTHATCSINRHQRGAALVEYLPPLLFALMITIPAWAMYGDVVRQQLANAATKLAENYYHGWFWPVEDQVAAGSPVRPGSDAEGGPSTGEDVGAGGGSGGGLPGSGNPFSPTPGSDIGNPFAPDSGGAGGDAPLQCSTPSGGPQMSPVGNAATYTQIGNPIDLGTGNKLQTEHDYHSWRPAGLQFVRYYNSVLGAENTGLGHGWRHSYQRAIVLADKSDIATIWRDDGSQYHFTHHDGQWQPPLGIVEQLRSVNDDNGNRTGWTYTTVDEQVEHYDASGRLQRIDHSGGQSQQLIYDDEGRLSRVVDSRGEQLVLQWRGAHLQRVTTPAGDRLTYDYDERLNLATVVRRVDGLRGLFAGLRTPERRYHYDDTRHPHALTGLDDATGQRFATWSYDELGRAISSEHGDGAERIALDYRRPADKNSRERIVAVTNALGHRAIYTLEPARAGKWRLRAIDGAPAIDCVAVRQQHRYDARGFLTLQYGDGIASHYQRDAYGRLIDEQHGLQIDQAERLQSTPGAVRIERHWQPERPLLIRERHYSWQVDDRHVSGHWQPVQQRDYRHDERGRPTQVSFRDLIENAGPNDKSREWHHAYIFVDSERTRLREHHVTDPLGRSTVYRYDDDERLQSITNPLNQVTRYHIGNRHGRPTRIDLPDGQQLDLNYDLRGRPIRLVRSNGDLRETTTAEYDAVGRPTRLTYPDGSEQHVIYNSAGQLTAIRNGWGEQINLAPNVLHGQWQQMQLLDASGLVHQQHHRRFNARGQLVALIGNAGQQTRIDYDPRGNPIHLRQGHEDPAQADFDRNSHGDHDTLDRMLAWTDAANHTTRFQYTPAGPLAAVTDANGNSTTYQRNGFGELIREQSPASGGVIQRFDAVGNVIERRAAGALQESATHFQYDALNRLTLVDYPGELDDIRYHYDQTGPIHGNGIGRLTRIETASQILDYLYDALGRRIADTTQEKDSDGNITHTTTLTWQYDNNGRLAAIGYPDGSEARYHYDRERVTHISYREPAGTTHTLVDNIAYAPFGGPLQWRYGNGLQQTKRRDQDGRITEIALHSTKREWPGSQQQAADAPLWSQRYDYDLYQNIERLTIDDTPYRYGYDAVDRLIEEIGEKRRISYAYDPVGNRLREARNGATIDYQYGPGNRLLKRGDTEVLIDDRGNLVKERLAIDADNFSFQRRFDYNIRNRPEAFYTNDELVARYDYNPLGLRISKTIYTEQGEEHTRFNYAPDTRLLAEQTDGKSTDYIWLGNQPIAAINTEKSGNATPVIHRVHIDHLHTPRVATDSEGRIVWRWNSEAFGNSQTETDPDGDGNHVDIRLRFPGQYHDEESGLYYNVFRLYDSAAGRYTQSDPMGLADGSNRYGYVHQNPLASFDNFGLFTVYLGGAGMDGPYIPDQIASLEAIGVGQVVAGRRTADDGFIGNVLDAAAVLKARDRWEHNTGFTPGPFGVPYKTEQDWSWSSLGLSDPCLAPGEQINLIGYSWGSLVAAQTAAFYADKGVYIDSVVLIGSPISSDFLEELKSNGNIGNVIVRDLGAHGDPIYAGMTVSELMSNMPTLLKQFTNVNEGEGHFYYNPDTEEGKKRRNDLAEDLFSEGLR